MTPDLMAAGAERLAQAEQRAAQGATASGGRSAAFLRPLAFAGHHTFGYLAAFQFRKCHQHSDDSAARCRASVEGFGNGDDSAVTRRAVVQEFEKVSGVA